MSDHHDLTLSIIWLLMPDRRSDANTIPTKIPGKDPQLNCSVGNRYRLRSVCLGLELRIGLWWGGLGVNLYTLSVQSCFRDTLRIGLYQLSCYSQVSCSTLRPEWTWNQDHCTSTCPSATGLWPLLAVRPSPIRCLSSLNIIHIQNTDKFRSLL